jgi:serine/threonine protein kinase
VKLNNLDFEHANWKVVSDEAKEFVRSALTSDPLERPSAIQLLNHPWLKALTDKHQVSQAQELRIGENIQDFLKTNTF